VRTGDLPSAKQNEGEYQQGGHVGAVEAKHPRFKKSHGLIVRNSFIVWCRNTGIVVETELSVGTPDLTEESPASKEVERPCAGMSGPEYREWAS